MNISQKLKLLLKLQVFLGMGLALNPVDLLSPVQASHDLVSEWRLKPTLTTARFPSEPKLRGNDYAGWVREATAWVQNHEARLSPIDTFKDLSLEISFKTKSDKTETTILVKGKQDDKVIKEFDCTVPHRVDRQIILTKKEAGKIVLEGLRACLESLGLC